MGKISEGAAVVGAWIKIAISKRQPKLHGTSSKMKLYVI
jgi:hypothetical protein